MSFMIKNFGQGERKLNIKFHSERVYDEKYMKAKVRESGGVIKTKFLSNKGNRVNITLAKPAKLLILLWEWKTKIIRSFI